MDHSRSNSNTGKHWIYNQHNLPLELIATNLSLSFPASLKFPSNPFQEPFSRGRVNHHYGYLDLRRANFEDLQLPIAKLGKCARFHDTDRWEANLPVLECTLMLDVGGSKRIKQSSPR